jgi:HSP20 family molecular chaperone IbpA
VKTQSKNVTALYGGDRVLINGVPQTVWSVSRGARTVRVTFDVPGERKADTKVTYSDWATVTVEVK